MKSKNTLVTLAIMLFLVGCITNNPKSYNPINEKSYFILDGDVIGKNKISATLSKGRYEAVFQKEGYVYYLGAPKSLILDGRVKVNGGIAIAGTEACFLFIQNGDDSEEVNKTVGGVIIPVLSKLEIGRIREFKNDNDCSSFVPKINIIEE